MIRVFLYRTFNVLTIVGAMFIFLFFGAVALLDTLLIPFWVYAGFSLGLVLLNFLGYTIYARYIAPNRRFYLDLLQYIGVDPPHYPRGLETYFKSGMIYDSGSGKLIRTCRFSDFAMEDWLFGY